MTVRQTPVLGSPILTSDPIGLSWPQTVLAVDSEMTITGWEVAVSDSAKKRPARSGVPMTRKYSGEAPYRSIHGLSIGLGRMRPFVWKPQQSPFPPNGI